MTVCAFKIIIEVINISICLRVWFVVLCYNTLHVQLVKHGLLLWLRRWNLLSRKNCCFCSIKTKNISLRWLWSNSNYFLLTILNTLFVTLLICLYHSSNFIVQQFFNEELNIFICRHILHPHLRKKCFYLLTIDLNLLLFSLLLLLLFLTRRLFHPSITDGVLAFTSWNTFDVVDIFTFFDQLFKVEATLQALSQIIFFHSLKVLSTNLF